MGLKAGLHAQLVRAACCLPLLQPHLVPHLVSYMPAYNWSDPLQAAWLASLIPDVVDAVQSVEGSLGEAPCSQFVISSCLLDPSAGANKRHVD